MGCMGDEEDTPWTVMASRGPAVPNTVLNVVNIPRDYLRMGRIAGGP